MKNYVIIGSSGFIGKNLVEYLKQKKYHVTEVQRRQLYDLDQVKFSESDVIIHTAGLAHDTKNTDSKEKYYRANFDLTRKLFDHFLNSEAKKFVFISSVKAAADDVAGILTEHISPNPKTEYGRTKLMAEQYILRQDLPEGKEVYILRPCMTHGEGNKGNLNLLYKIVNKGIPYPLAAYNNFRSFLSVKNLCFVISEMAEREDIPTGVYNVSDDEPLSTADVFSILAEAVNTKAKFWKLPRIFISFLARVGDVFHLPLNTERLKKLTENYVVSNAKLKAALKKPLPFRAAEGLLMTARHFNNTILHT